MTAFHTLLFPLLAKLSRADIFYRFWRILIAFYFLDLGNFFIYSSKLWELLLKVDEDIDLASLHIVDKVINVKIDHCQILQVGVILAVMFTFHQFWLYCVVPIFHELLHLAFFSASI